MSPTGRRVRRLTILGGLVVGLALWRKRMIAAHEVGPKPDKK